jgi:hypothetical protein
MSTARKTVEYGRSKMIVDGTWVRSWSSAIRRTADMTNNMNHLTLSDDGTELIISDERRRATLRSTRPGGFTADELEKARYFRLSEMWYLPQTRISKGELMLDWGFRTARAAIRRAKKLAKVRVNE